MQTPAIEFCDLVIIGGGLTGLSLACWLADTARVTQQALPKVCVLEPRETYTNDRTWCFWDLEPHPFTEVIRHRWPRWQVGDDRQRVIQDGGDQHYAMLTAEDVYQKAQATIATNPQLNLFKATRVEQVSVETDRVLVDADRRQWQARAVIDTRPPESSAMREVSGLWQLFTGFEIDCSNHGYALDTVHLMDFQPATEAISFVYLLPLGPDRLLVEWTEFLPLRQKPDYEDKLNAWLRHNLKHPFRVVRREAGALPMMEIVNSSGAGRLVNAGIRGGWMRPSSGFHFAACQRGCKMLAAQILAAHRSGQWLLATPQTRHIGLRWMDRVFLKALRRQPHQAPAWFIALFAGTSAAQMCRFMNDQARLTDILAVIRALPPGPLIKAAILR
jgi:lycopene beta-cyclase